MTARPQSTPPPLEHMNDWAFSSSQPSYNSSSDATHHPSLRHSISGHASTLPRPMYHPLQHQRGSTNTRSRLPGTPPMRRVSSPDLKVQPTLRLRSASRQQQQQQQQQQHEGEPASAAGGSVRSLEQTGTQPMRKIVRRGSFQGLSGRRGGGGTGERQVQHSRSQSMQMGATGGFKSQRRSADVYQSYYSAGSQTGQTTGTQTGSASSQISPTSHASFVASWEGSSQQSDQDLMLRKPSGPPQYSHNQETSMTTRVPLLNRGEAWQLEEDEDRGGHSGRPSGQVDEAPFAARLHRHYFHSAHTLTGTPSHPHTVARPHSTIPTGTPSQQPPQPPTERPNVPCWSISVADRHAASAGGQDNPTPGTAQDKNPPSGTRKILSNINNQQQRVADWLLELPFTTAEDKLSKKAHPTSRSLPCPPKQIQPSEFHSGRTTRTFSYTQAQVHPVNAQDTPPHKGFNPQQMSAEHRRSTSVTSEGEMQSTASTHSRESAAQSHKPRPKSSPHPHRARTKSSPNPILQKEVVKKVKGQQRKSSNEGKMTGATSDSLHPDKRFSTGNMHIGEEKPLSARLNTRRNSTPVQVSTDLRSHMTSHAPFPDVEEETASSDDTGGHSDSEGIFRKGKSRSKSSGSLISKLARKFGRNSMKPDQYAHEAPPPSEENDEDGPITMVVSEGHTLQVPIPRLQQQKKLKSMSTSHLDSSYDGSQYHQQSPGDRFSPDYFEPRSQDDYWYRSQGTPPLGTPHGTPKMSRSSSRSRQRSSEPDPEGPVGLPAVFRSGSKRNLSADMNEVLFDLVEQGNYEGVEQLLETNSITEMNITDEDDFMAVDLAAMLGHHDITKLLLARGARDSTRFCREPFSRFHRIMTLLTETERELDSLRYELVVQNSSGGSSSTLRDMERRLKRWEWRAHLFKRMKANYESADLPEAPTDVTLHVTSNRSLTVKFIEPANSNGAPITRYKIEWCQGSDEFAPIVGEFVLTDLRTNEYIIPDLNKGEQYFVRVSAFNMKGFGQPQLSNPACAIPSSWHDDAGTLPRFEGSTDNIHIISAQLNMSLSNSPPISPPPGTPSMYRKTTVKKSISKLFGPNIRFQKSLRPGVYISSLVHSDDSRVVVTMDEQLPTIEISDSPASSSIGVDFVWLAKVACTWDHVKGMMEISDSYTSSPTIQFRNRILHAILELQTALGLQDLGLLHPVPYRDSHGAVVFVIVQYVKDTRSIQSSSLKWTSLPRLWKKRPQPSTGDLQAIPVPDQLILDAQEIIAHHGNSTRPLSRGLYLGYLKARSTVASMKVICSREYPNVLPHHKIRDNPNISQEEWKWLKSLSSSSCSPTISPSLSPSHAPTITPSHSHTPPTVTGPHSLQRLLPTTVDTFLHNLGIFKEDAEKHQLYCHEVIELNEDISLLLILPPSDQVCTPPGSTDHFAKLSDFVALPINTFEIMQLYTYQKAFMTKFSMVSARLDIELLTAQQRMREAFSKAEVTAAKRHKEELDGFQERTDQAWKEMRWIEEAVQKGRDQSVSPNTLLPVKTFREVVRANIPNGQRRIEPSSGYLRVYPAYTTGLVKGTSVKLFITESTTTGEVIRLVVQQLEKARLEKGVPGVQLTEDDIDDFFLVARQHGRETELDAGYTPLQLQTHSQRWRLLVRRFSEEQRANEHTTSV